VPWANVGSAATVNFVFSRLPAMDRLIIECFECLTGYSDPLDLRTSPQIRMEDMESAIVTRPEVVSSGLGHLIAY
jgi:hypothetical protein